MTGTAKRTFFGFLNSHILRKASTQTASFPSLSVLRQDESRCYGTETDLDSMDTSSQDLSQPSLILADSRPTKWFYTEGRQAKQ